ncbi:MAG: EF-Tu/IF-2/RF-3 family GTPase, partial [Candidatus Norongarragalinales archaeon]
NRFSSITEARTEVLAFEPPMLDGPVKGVIDHAFEVKGVGSVALGVLLRGRLRVHDKLALYPSMKTIEVRSIQKQDHDVQSAECWDRFGISFKGASSDDVRKGDFLSARPLQVVEALEAEVEATKFLREPIGKSEGKETLHACVGLQVVPCVVEGQVKPGAKTKCRVSLQKPLAFEAGDTALFLRLDAKTLRVAGKAVL